MDRTTFHFQMLILSILMSSFSDMLPWAHSKDPFLSNQLIRRCVNLGNALEAPIEGEWGMVLESEYFKLIQQAGFTAVRVPIRWSAHAQEVAPYLIDATFLKRIDWVVAQALEHNLALVLNMHHYRALASEPIAHRNRYMALWRQIATHFRQAPNSVLFELLNEPNGKLTPALWNLLLKDCIQVVRQSNPDRTVIIGPANWNHISSELDELVLPDNNVILTVHYYYPFHFTHQGAEWVSGSDKWLGTSWVGSPDQQSRVKTDLLKANTWAKAQNVPVFLGEFGAYSKAAFKDRVKWTHCVRQQAEQLRVSWSYWEFGAGFGIYDRENRRWKIELLNALIPNDRMDLKP